MRARLIPWLTVAALLGAGCSGDEATDAPPSSATSSSTTSATTTTTTTPPPTSSTTTTTTRVPGVTLAPSTIFVTTGGMGPIRVGMGVEEASEAAGFPLDGEPNPDVSDTCYHVAPPADQPDYAGVSFMVLDDIIVRVEVGGDSTATTRSGAGVGISEDQLRAMFPGQIQSTEGLAGGGTAFEFVPQDEGDVEYRVIFIFEDDVVSQYWAGILPGVAFSEGCL